MKRAVAEFEEGLQDAVLLTRYLEGMMPRFLALPQTPM
jgi:hypothetical protein